MTVKVCRYDTGHCCLQVAPFDLLASLPEYTPAQYSIPAIDSA